MISAETPVDSSSINWKQQLALFVLGVASAIPLAVSLVLIVAWLSVSNINLTTIGLSSLLGLPYLAKFLWAPLLDRLSEVSNKNYRKHWLIGLQAVLLVIFLLFPFQEPQQLFMLMLLSFCMTLISATFDMGLDAYRVLAYPDEKLQATASSRYLLGYRIGLLLGGALALIGADRFGFSFTFPILGGWFCLSIAAVYWLPTLQANHESKQQWKISASLRTLMMKFSSKKSLLLALAFVATYKLSETLTLSLNTPFLIEQGFSLTQIGFFNKTAGFAAAMLGTVLGGYLVSRFLVWRVLFFAGIAQILSGISYIVMTYMPHQLSLMVVAITLENLTGAIATVSFMAYLASLCDIQYTTTQYALLSALASVGRVVTGPVAGWFVMHWGWTSFYSTALLSGLPALIFIFYLPFCQGKHNTVK